MTESATPSFDAVEAALRLAGSHADTAAAHGTLCGLACLLGDGARSPGLAEVMGDAGAELVEYIRVSVQLVFEELAPIRQQLARSGMH